VKAPARPQSLPEELANSVSHGIGFLAAVLAAPFFIGNARANPDQGALIGALAFSISAALLYLSSTIYHALPRGGWKLWFDRLDHAAIYFLIAGSYTPFTLGALRGVWGWTLFGVVWTLAVVGATLKLTGVFKNRALSTALYLAMGWLVVVAAKPLLKNVPMPGLLWLAAGGLAYTVGVVFYNLKQVRYMHFVWHLFVLAGTACHAWAIYWYAG